MRPIFPLVVLALLAAVSPAQLVVGDLAVTGFLTSQFTVLHAGGSSTVFPTSSFGGISHAILYDPTPPGSFLIGGVGFLGRITVVGPGTATYAPITAALGTVSQMSFDGSTLVVFDSGADQVVRVDPATGLVTPVTSGVQPWGADLSAGCFDPNTGDSFAGGNNGIWRIPAGSSTPVPFAAGWTPGSSFVSGLAIDLATLEVVATLLTVNRFVRISSGGVLTDLAPPGSMPGPNAVDVDQNGDFVAVASFGQVYRIPSAGGSATLIGTASGISGAGTGIAAVVPGFRLEATPVGAGGLSVAITGVPSGVVEGFTIASFNVSLPVGTGPIFGLSPDATSVALVLAIPVATPGSLLHWTWPVAPPLYPAAAFNLPVGTLPPLTTFDLIAVAIHPVFGLIPTPVDRVTIN